MSKAFEKCFRFRCFLLDCLISIQWCQNSLFAAVHAVACRRYCAIWLANILAAYWMYVGAQQVVRVEDPLPLGGYIVVLGVFRQMGLAYKAMYSNYLQCQQSFPAMWQVTEDHLWRVELDSAP